MKLLILLSTFFSILSIFLALSLRARNHADEGAAVRSFGAAMTKSWYWPTVRNLAVWNAALFPEWWIDWLDLKLSQLGDQFAGVTGAEYFGLVELMSFFVFVGMCLLLALGGVGLGSLFLVSAAFGVAGLWFGFSWLAGEVSNRERFISRQYPYFIDLAVMSMGSGASLQETIEGYVRDAHNDALADELKLMLQEMRLGKTFEDAVLNFQQRIPSEDVKSSLDAVLQGHRMGTPINQLFRDQSDALRFRRTQLAERAAEELKVKLVTPSILMMVAILFLILGPVVIEIARTGVVG